MESCRTFEEQTECVVKALLSGLLENEEISFRSLKADSAGRSLPAAASDASTFDPVVIASRLRVLGDLYNEDLEQPAQQLIAEVTKGKVEQFGATVDSLSKIWSTLNPGLGYERAFLAVSVKLFVYLAQKVPSVVSRLQLADIINGNRQVRGYIEAHGGWENLES
uniref:BCL2 like 15 n=1 Tax=Sphenodon punctatus TaxID=8508 RepID=A0A8D0GZZ7_SPHPU